MLRTLLMNSTKKEYVSITADFPTGIGIYLLQLEKNGWNLAHDDIYIMYTRDTHGYQEVNYFIQIQPMR